MKLAVFLLFRAALIVLGHENGEIDVDVCHDHDHAHSHKALGLEERGDDALRLPGADILLNDDADVVSHYVGNITKAKTQEDLKPPSGHNWSHTTPCVNSISSKDAFCVFTDTSYADGHGISFITTTQRVAYLASLPSFTSPSSTTEPSPAKYTISFIPGKGLGLIAATRIPRGSVILSSHPTLMIDHRVFDELLRTDYMSLQAAGISSLPAAHRRAFFNLSSTQSTADASASGLSWIALADSIISTNAFDIPPPPSSPAFQPPPSPIDPTGLNDSLWYTLFASPISRINHDCRPNAGYRFDWNDGFVQVITAVRDILPGEEITISYTNPVQSRQARQNFLKTVWGFACSCELCSRSKTRAEESDRRVRSIKKVRRFLREEKEGEGEGQGERREDDDGSEVKKGKAGGRRTKMAELLVSLYEMEGLWGMIYQAYAMAAREYSKVGEAWMAMKWAGMAVEFGEMVLAEENEEVREMRELARDPWGHATWMMSRKRSRGGHGDEAEGEERLEQVYERPEGFGIEDESDGDEDEEGW